MFEKFNWLLDRYQELSEALSQPDIIADQPKWQALRRLPSRASKNEIEEMQIYILL